MRNCVYTAISDYICIAACSALVEPVIYLYGHDQFYQYRD